MAKRRTDSSCQLPSVADVADDGDDCALSFDAFIQETESRKFRCGTWICKNDQFIDNVNHLGPADFVARLKAADNVAWDCVRKYVVLPIFKQKKYGGMAWEKTIPFDDACAYVYEVAMADGRIANLSSPKKLKSWMQFYVRKYIRSYFTPKDKRTDSIEVRFAKKQTKSHNGMNREVEDPLSRIEDKKQTAAQKDVLDKDEKAIIRNRFHKLWKDDPVKAYVLLLKVKDNLPSIDIREICGKAVTSSQNVDKLFERAKKLMRASLSKKEFGLRKR